MIYKSKRSKACAISREVRKKVELRDSIDGVPSCIFCGRAGRGEAHLINRSQGGLGIEQNIITVCRACHREMDNGKHTQIYRDKAEAYLKSIYPDCNRSQLFYNKWR